MHIWSNMNDFNCMCNTYLAYQKKKKEKKCNTYLEEQYE